MEPSWKDEARGIEPWPLVSAMVVVWRGERQALAGTTYSGPGEVIYDDEGNNTGFYYPVAYAPDLENPDVLAAFDRRLALRLGAPSFAVEQGVIVGTDEEHTYVVAGFCALEEAPWVSWVWENRSHIGLGDDPLLMRVRLWHCAAAK